jgi:hypothetical protein
MPRDRALWRQSGRCGQLAGTSNYGQSNGRHYSLFAGHSWSLRADTERPSCWRRCPFTSGFGFVINPPFRQLSNFVKRGKYTRRTRPRGCQWNVIFDFQIGIVLLQRRIRGLTAMPVAMTFKGCSHCTSREIRDDDVRWASDCPRYTCNEQVLGLAQTLEHNCLAVRVANDWGQGVTNHLP